MNSEHPLLKPFKNFWSYIVYLLGFISSIGFSIGEKLSTESIILSILFLLFIHLGLSIHYLWKETQENHDVLPKQENMIPNFPPKPINLIVVDGVYVGEVDGKKELYCQACIAKGSYSILTPFHNYIEISSYKWHERKPSGSGLKCQLCKGTYPLTNSLQSIIDEAKANIK